jgi:hypothetical protein
MLSDKELRVIGNHIHLNIGEPAQVLHEIIPFDPHIDIEIVPPSPQRPYYTLITAGMSELPMTVPKGKKESAYAELMLCVPASWKFDEKSLEGQRYSFPIDWLRLMARFPHDGGTFLAPGHTIPNGDPPEPLAPGSKLCCLLIREPVTTPDGFRTLTIKKKTIRFYALIPLYEDEMRFKVAKGYKALDALLQENGVTELLDVKRPSVVSGSKG